MSNIVQTLHKVLAIYTSSAGKVLAANWAQMVVSVGAWLLCVYGHTALALGLLVLAFVAACVLQDYPDTWNKLQEELHKKE